MNILLAFKAEPDAGMLAEKSGWRRLRVIADRMFRYCEVYSVLMNRPRRAVGAEKNGTPMSLTALSMGMNGRCTGCAISWHLGLRKLYCWRRRQICALRRNLSLSILPNGSTRIRWS